MTQEDSMQTPLFPTCIFSDDFKSVYEPAEDTFLLLDALEKDLTLIKDKINPLVCLEVGCGSGAVITSLAKCLGPNKRLYFATDINNNALLTTKKCCSVNDVEGCVQLVRTDLTKALDIRLANNIDLLVFNPPYVPTPDVEVGTGDISSAWAGGRDGRLVINRFLALIPKLMSFNCLVYLIVLKENNLNDIQRQMKILDFHSTVILERRCGGEHLMAVRFSRTEL